jgi:hypothetical protein
MAAAKEVSNGHKSRSLSSIDKHVSIFSMKEGSLPKTTSVSDKLPASNQGNHSDKVCERREGKHVMWWRDATKKILHSLMRDDVTDSLTNDKKGMSAADKQEKKLTGVKKLSLMKHFYSEEVDSDVPTEVPSDAYSTEAMNNLSVRTKGAVSTSDNVSCYSTTSDCLSYKTIAEDVPQCSCI